MHSPSVIHIGTTSSTARRRLQPSLSQIPSASELTSMFHSSRTRLNTSSKMTSQSAEGITLSELVSITCGSPNLEASSSLIPPWKSTLFLCPVPSLSYRKHSRLQG